MLNDFKSTRQIRVFISSTFQDMHDERDVLIKKTFPLLRQKAAERDVALTELDLRWGITPEESRSGKVVEICFREIENSVPFFIGIIGNRYGWIPSRKDLDESVRERFPQVESYLERRLSVTEMEMQFGVLQRPEQMNAFFYIDSAADSEPDEPEKLSTLKKVVLENGRYPVSSYSDTEDLSSQVESAFTNLLDRLFPAGQDLPAERLRIGQNAFINNLCQSYIRNDEYMATLDFWAEHLWKNLVVTGDYGSGKSALLANWIKGFSKADGCVLLYHFIGSGGCPGTVESVAASLCRQVKDAFGFDCDDDDSMDALSKLYKRIENEKPSRLVIVLDGVDKLMDVKYPELLEWLPSNIRSRQRVIFSHHGDEKVDQRFEALGNQILRVRPLDRAHRETLIRRYLSLYAKRLNDDQVEWIASDNLLDNPKRLRVLLDELVNFGDFSKLDEKIRSYLGKTSYHDFYNTVLNGCEKDFGKDFVRRVLCLLAVSKLGLYEDEIIRLTGSRQLDWSRFFCSFRSHLKVEEGRILLSDAHVKEAVEKRQWFYSDITFVRSCRQDIISLLEGSRSPRAMEEIPYQYCQLYDHKNLHDCLIDPKVFMYLYLNNRSGLREYWVDIYEQEAGKLSDYQPIVEALPEEGKASFLFALAEFAREGRPDPESAVSFIEQALPLAGTEMQKASILASAGKTYLTMAGDVAKALEYSEQALKIMISEVGSKDIALADVYDVMAECYGKMHEEKFRKEKQVTYEASKERDCLEKALKLRKDYYGSGSLDVANTLGRLSVACVHDYDEEEAYEYAEESRSTIFTIRGADSEEYADSLENEAEVLVFFGNYNIAIERCREALDVRKKYFSLYGDGVHPSQARPKELMARAYIGIARKYLEEVLDIYQWGAGITHPKNIETMRKIAALSKIAEDSRADWDEDALKRLEGMLKS